MLNAASDGTNLSPIDAISDKSVVNIWPKVKGLAAMFSSLASPETPSAAFCGPSVMLSSQEIEYYLVLMKDLADL